MMNAPYEKEFVFWDGSRAKNILELMQLLEKIPGDEFYSHVNDWKNDFAKWVYDVFNDADLASRLGKEKTIAGNIKVLKDAMNQELAQQNIFALSKKSEAKKDEKDEKQEHKHEDKSTDKHKDKHDKSHESQPSEPKKRWYHHILSRKKKEEVVHRLDKEFKKEDEELETAPEQMIWIILYGLLIGLIVVLLIYKFVFNGSLG